MATSTNNVSTEAWVKALEKDGKIIENFTVLFGYIGQGSSNNTFKLYHDLLLQQGIEIRNEDVIYSIKLNSSQSPLGGSYVWIKNAQEYLYGVSYTSQQQNQDPTNYFQGEIYEKYVSQQEKLDAQKKAKQKTATKKATPKKTVAKRVAVPKKANSNAAKKVEATDDSKVSTSKKTSEKSPLTKNPRKKK